MMLNEDQHRAKIIELLEGRDAKRMDVWISSGILAGVLDGELVEKCLLEELPRRSHEAQLYWGSACTACLSGMAHPN